MKLAAPLEARLADETAERVRQSHAQALREVQARPAVGAEVVSDVTLQNGVGRLVSHRLGRRPVFVGVSAIRGASTVGMVKVGLIHSRGRFLRGGYDVEDGHEGAARSARTATVHG